MALYTPFAPEELAHVAERYALGALLAFAGVAAGSINTNYRLTTSSGRYFLRHTTARSERELRFEAALLRHLVEVRFPGPRLVSTPAGEPLLALKGGRVSVFHFLAGEERSRESFWPDAAEHLGEVLARLHLATAQLSLSRENPYGLELVRQWVLELSGHPRPEVAAAAAALEDALAVASSKDEGLLPRGVIHADLFMDNVKWIGGDVSAFFDFEMACVDSYVLDLAITLNAWCFDGGYVKPLCEALLRGYQRRRPLSDAERTKLFPQALFGAARYTASRIRDFHLSPLPPERLARKDYRTYLSRVEALRELGPTGFAALVSL